MSGPWDRYASPPTPGGPWDQYADGASLPAPAPLSEADRGALWLSEKMDAATQLPVVGGTLRALRDRAQGITQVIARPFASAEDMAAYEGMRKGSEQKYQDARKQSGDEGIDWDRAVGGAAIDAIVTSKLMGGSMRNPIPPAPTMLGRMGQGAKVGAASGFMSPADSEKQGGEFWLTKGLQTGGGALVGGAMPLVVEPAVAAVTSGLNKAVSRMSGLWKSASGQMSDNAIAFNISADLSKAGVDWSKLSTDVKKSMVRDVREALKAGKPLTPDQLGRYADFKALGEAPTRGQLTLDPILFKTEQNLKGVQGVGEDLTARLDSQNAKLFSSLDTALKGAGSKNVESYDAGKSIETALQGVLQTGKTKVDDAYDLARRSAGGDTDVPLQRVAQLFGEWRNRLDYDLLPGPVRSRLKELGLEDGVQRKVFTIADAEDLIKTINYNYNRQNSAQAGVLDTLRSTVKKSMDDIADTGGPAAANFAEARKLAAARFGQIDSTPALKALKEGSLAPDDLVKKYVIGSGAKVADVENLLKAGGPQVAADIKAAVLGQLRDVAQGRSPNGAPQFQFAEFSKMVDRIGPEKLRLIFNPQEVETIERAVRVGSVLNFNPRSVTINRSGTTQALLDLLNRAQGIPFVNSVVAKPVISAIQQNQAYNAANSGLLGVPGGVMSDALRAQLAERAGLLGAAAVAPLPGLLAQ